MNIEDQFRNPNCCERKVSYATEREAWFSLRKLMRKHRPYKGAVAYHCPACERWHIGRLREEDRK